MVDISTKLGKVKLSNPLILASGFLGVTGASLVNVAKHGAGGVISKSISLEPRTGHKAPVVLTLENSVMNAVGLSNAGAEASIEELDFAKENTESAVIASIFAPTVKDFGKIAKEISKSKADMIEINISCPNVADEFGKPFSTDPKIAADVVKIVKKNTNLPIITKLSPNVPNIKEIAKAVEKAGTDAISAINTVGPGMVIDIKSRQPILENKAGGLSGPSVKPIAIRCVYDIYEVVKVPILGLGGVTTGEDAIEMMMAGASAVGIGSGIYFRGIDIFNKVNHEIKGWMENNGYTKLKQIMGGAHR